MDCRQVFSELNCIIIQIIQSFRASNTRIYNLDSVPQITRFLLTNAVISSKANPCSGSIRQKEGTGESGIGDCHFVGLAFKGLKVIKHCQRFCYLFQILYLKQQSIILWCFCSLKFEKRLYSNELTSCIFCSNGIIYTAGQIQ